MALILIDPAEGLESLVRDVALEPERKGCAGPSSGRTISRSWGWWPSASWPITS